MNYVYLDLGKKQYCTIAVPKQHYYVSEAEEKAVRNAPTQNVCCI